MESGAVLQGWTEGQGTHREVAFVCLIEETWIARPIPYMACPWAFKYTALRLCSPPCSHSQPSTFAVAPHIPAYHGRHISVRARPAHAAQGRDHRLRVHPRWRRRPQETPQKPHHPVMPQLPYLKTQGSFISSRPLLTPTMSSSSSVALVRQKTALFEVYTARPGM